MARCTFNQKVFGELFLIINTGILLEKGICQCCSKKLYICRNYYKLLILEDNKLVGEVEETHVIRYLFPREIAGFEVLMMCGFPDLSVKVTQNVLNITVVAGAAGEGKSDAGL